MSRSWDKPYSSRIFSPTIANYSSIVWLNEKAYGAMPAVEQTLTSYLSPSSASSLKALKLPTRSVRLTSGLVGKAYMAAGQAGACLHTMAVLQACQADLLNDLDEEEEGESDIVAKLHSQSILTQLEFLKRNIARLHMQPWFLEGTRRCVSLPYSLHPCRHLLHQKLMLPGCSPGSQNGLAR